MKKIKIAAVQMNAEPAPTPERLARAEVQVTQAAQSGAELVVLPEVFNTGYTYSDANYLRAEGWEGQTANWMRRVALEQGVHLAGTFLRYSGGEIYNTLLLVAPNGREWHYDKHYPWAWERAYFRPGEGITVADTELGRLGLLICWDVAHPSLWRQYAGQVDMMIASSSPPRAHALQLLLPDGGRVSGAACNPLIAHSYESAEETFDAHLRRQAAHLGVPVVNTGGAGRFVSTLPRPYLSLATNVLFRPDLWGALPRADQVQAAMSFFPVTYVADAEGQVLARVPADEEGYVLAEVSLPEAAAARPARRGPQPRYGVAWSAYVLDRFANLLLCSYYRHHMRRYYGPTAASRGWRKRRLLWAGLLLVLALLLWLWKAPRAQAALQGVDAEIES